MSWDGCACFVARFLPVTSLITLESMRLDKLLGITGCATRSESKKIIRSGGVTVNGRVARSPDEKVFPQKDAVCFCGKPVVYRKYTYILMNKPEGVVSATEDGRDKTVIDLLPDEIRKKDLFPCGRLDKNTLGLVILTNDGEGAHRLLSPKHHVSKSYLFKCLSPLSEENRVLLEKGVDIGGYITKPCQITLSDEYNGEIILTEGKYHQIKRMLEAVDNKITYLERVRFGSIRLDSSLSRGEWRYLTDDEEKLFSE